MDSNPELDICGRCLVQVNSTTVVRARLRDRVEPCQDSTSPGYLKKWVEDRLYGDGAKFEINNTIDRFVSISTWHGDPVCSWHLWVLADAEQKAGYRARALRAR